MIYSQPYYENHDLINCLDKKFENEKECICMYTCASYALVDRNHTMFTKSITSVFFYTKFHDFPGLENKNKFPWHFQAMGTLLHEVFSEQLFYEPPCLF